MAHECYGFGNVRAIKHTHRARCWGIWAAPQAVHKKCLPTPGSKDIAIVTRRDSDLEAFSHNPSDAHVPYWWVNNPTLGEFCFAMIGRADIEGSKSDVAMDAWPPQASYPCGHLRYALTDVPPQSNSPPDTVIGAGRRATGWHRLNTKKDTLAGALPSWVGAGETLVGLLGWMQGKL
ncbi:hypothetical protein GPALN_014832 [Globodera pallida]|nr:hypothetical protein GPALN_014832 [Globodera pallida]